MKTTAITGTTSGIGTETAKALNAAGHHLIMLNRNIEKSEKLKKQLPQPQNVTIIRCDLADLNSVKQAAEQVAKEFEFIDVLINNAGGIVPERKETKDGVELTFGMNHLGHYLLTHLLIPLLEKGREPRIINVSSEAHRGAKPDIKNMQSGKYRSFIAYANAKLYNIYFTKMLHKKLKDKGIAANALHPGVVNTGFGKEYSGFIGFLINLVRPLMISARKGAETTIYLASNDNGYKHSGKYFKNKKVKKPSPAAFNEDNIKALKTVSNQLIEQHTGIRPDFREHTQT